jgi:hypothetical protein
MKNTNNNTEKVFNRMKIAIRNRARDHGRVSAVDILGVGVSVQGAERGILLRRAFAELTNSGFLRSTEDTRYNEETRSSVTVYELVERRW